jgi:hypothetical protein
MTERVTTFRSTRFASPARNCLRALCVLLATLAGVATHAQTGLDGDWRLTLNDQGRIHTGILSFETADGRLTAFIDGGPVPIVIQGNRIEIDLDYRDGGGRLLSYGLAGDIGPDRLEGVLTPSLDGPSGAWHATREVAHAAVPAAPVDLSGIWSRTSSGTAKVHLDYTPAAQAIVDNYSYIDDPALRCVSPGLVRVSGWPYPLEILQTDQQVTILYESFHEVRRIFLDGRGYEEDSPHRAMGYSLGHWDGSTLVVETEMLTSAYVDLNGQPLSENARVVERMSLDDDGQTLRSEMTVYDPEYYQRPITRHRSWRKTPDTTILEYDCDPYPFFRGLELEGKLDEYWQRMRQRR